ncbi:MAG: tRNA glutamyl-Q(34) synthetase GluQRS [Alphaproteobacteria bacterium]
MSPGHRGRFAPSPTGDLHMGSAATALVAWLAARSAGASFVLRVEDIDAPRVVPGCEAEQLDELRWLGLDWDEGPDAGGRSGPYRQSERIALYEAALDRLRAHGLTYLCDCSRAEIARVASAPHAGDEGPRYPGTCRPHAHAARDFRRPPAVRLAVPPGEVVVRDRWQGEVRHDVARDVGDFVLRRGDGVFAYQLAVVVDDLAMGIEEVVRGADLLDSSPRQALLARLLGGQPPAFAHAPLVVGPDGERLAKRARGVPLRERRLSGETGPELVGRLARMLGLVAADEHGPIEPRDLVGRGNLAALAGVQRVRLPGAGDLPDC